MPMASGIFRYDCKSVDRLDVRLRSRSGAHFLRKTDGFNPESNFTNQGTGDQKLEILGQALIPPKSRLSKPNPGSFDTLSDELKKKINRIETSVENLRYFAVALGIKIIENSSTKQSPEKITIDDFKQLHRLICIKLKAVMKFSQKFKFFLSGFLIMH